MTGTPDTTDRRVARIRDMLDHWPITGNQFIRWLLDSNEALDGAAPGELILAGDYTIEAMLASLTPEWCWVEA